MIKTMPNEISNRWFTLRKDIFSQDNILNQFNEFIESIPQESFQKEKDRWKNIPGYGMEQIEEFLKVRLDYIDGIMKERQKIDFIKIQQYVKQIAIIAYRIINILGV